MYERFLKSKLVTSMPSGFKCSVDELHPSLYHYHKDLVRWALSRGKAALFTMTVIFSMRRMRYNFPRHKDVSNGGILNQIHKMNEELDEVLEAAMTPDVEHLTKEVCDYIHAGESLLRILEEFHGANRHKARCEVERRCNERGYYNES